MDQREQNRASQVPGDARSRARFQHRASGPRVAPDDDILEEKEGSRRPAGTGGGGGHQVRWRRFQLAKESICVSKLSIQHSGTARRAKLSLFPSTTNWSLHKSWMSWVSITSKAAGPIPIRRTRNFSNARAA